MLQESDWRKVKFLLINPPRFHGIPVIREERCEITERYSVVPPYSLLQMAAILRREGYGVDLIDANGSNIDYDAIRKKIEGSKHYYPFVIFRFTPTTFDWDMKTAEIVKGIAPNTKTIGLCCTLNTLSVDVMFDSPHLDIFIRHEYERVIGVLSEVLSGSKDLRNVRGITYRDASGKIVANESAVAIEDYDSLPMPAYDLLGDMKEYHINTLSGRPFTIMYTSRGCPFGCKFCTVSGTKWRKRSSKSVIEELVYLRKEKNIKVVSFFDETFTIDSDRVYSICEAIVKRKLKVKWYCNTRVELVDEGMLRAMYDGGCRGISFGVESANQGILDRNKKGSTAEQAERAIMLSKKVGIKTNCSFIFGLPGETKKTIKETRDFVKKTLPNGAQFNVFVPYPGTALYSSIYGDGDFIDWRALYQDDAVIGSGSLSANDINRARSEAYRSLYTNPKWWLQNINHVSRHPEDLPIAVMYAYKILDNFLIHHMKDAH